MTEEIKTGNEVIARWMGGEIVEIGFRFKEGISRGYHLPSELKYHKSWDWIIPVCLKWDSIPFSTWNPEQRIQYDAFAKRIEQEVLLFESPEYVRDTLVEAINWYTSNKK